MTRSLSTCAECNQPLGLDDVFCPACGAPPPMGMEPTLVDEEVAVAALQPDAQYDTRLQHVLGAEYELFEIIGEGGFARVHRARDRRLDRFVAIKVMRPDVSSPHQLDSFRREGVALAKLRHPGIVPIYDIREGEGLICFVMPFVEGDTLGQRMDRNNGRLPPFEAQRILSEICDALGAAHRAGIVHRDIKPANVILEGALNKALLMDFGIATLHEQGDQLAKQGVLVGTPQYMSPEQAAALDDIDHRSDLYSLGVVGYRMLTGRLPFEADTPQELLVKHVREEPKPLRQYNQSVPAPFAELIMRCLAKDPWQRPATAMDLWSDLKEVKFFPAGSASRAPSVVRRGPTAKFLAGLVAAGLVFGFVGGRVIYKPKPATPLVTPDAFVSRWLENATRPAGGMVSIDPMAVFDSGATVLHVAADLRGGGSDLPPRQLLSSDDRQWRVASVSDRPLLVRQIGDIAVVSGHYGQGTGVCGTAWFVLRAYKDMWRMLHVRLQDTSPTCGPTGRGPPRLD